MNMIKIMVLFGSLLFISLIHAANNNSIIIINEDQMTSIEVKEGISYIKIANADEQKISHNKYSQFNVSTAGVILDNREVTAEYIINEVINGAFSSLKGNINVKGDAAHVIIANPKGIVCESCGFSNTLSETLVSGSVSRPEQAMAIYHPTEIDFKTREDFTNTELLTGKISFIKSEINHKGSSFNQLNIVSNGININNKINSASDVNLFNKVAMRYDWEIKPSKLSIINTTTKESKKITRKKPSIGIIIIGKNQANISDGIYTDNKLNIYGENSLIYNYGTLDSSKLSLLLTKSFFENHGIIKTTKLAVNNKSSYMVNRKSGKIEYYFSELNNNQNKSNTMINIITNAKEINPEANNQLYNMEGGEILVIKQP